ncbi:Wzz/FepE/Etk N-terminal domain-containing protein [Streptococcus caprae]|uniref:Capsular polysaccharide biosynthesis protein CpsC n=1 Tax=Streptococcus caprae TaxID=1640501 RepID=A0ABV8CUC3_9STRE
MNTTRNAQVEIDVLMLLRKLWSKKFLITLIALIFGTLSLVASLFLLSPAYSSTTRLYVVNQNSTNNSLTSQDLQAGSYLVRDYQEIILSKDVMANVIADNGLDTTVDDLTSQVSVSIPTDTRVISITVEDDSPERAALVANSIREEASEKIKEVTKVEEVTTLEVAEVPTEPSSPNVKRNTILGILIGGFLTVVAILIKEVLDDRIKRPEDIEEVLGLTMLGVIPDIDKL